MWIVTIVFATQISLMAAPTTAPSPSNELASLREEVAQLRQELEQLRKALADAGVITIAGRPHDFSPVLTDCEKSITRSTTRPSVFNGTQHVVPQPKSPARR